MSVAKLIQSITLEDEFPRLLKRLGKNGKGNYVLGNPVQLEEDDAERAPILLDGQPVGNVLVKRQADGQDYVRRATIRKEALPPSIKIKKGDPPPYEGFIRLTYLEGKGRADNYKIPFP